MMKNPTQFTVIEKQCGKDVYKFYLADFSASVYRVSKRAAFGQKLVAYLYFRNEEEKQAKINEFIQKQLQIQAAKEERKAQRRIEEKGKRQEALQSIQIGDLFHDMRGYDMTHNDFLQVIDKKGCKIYCKYVCSEVTEGHAGYQGHERPIKNAFKGEGQRYVVNKWGGIKLNEYRHATKDERDRDYCFNYMD